MFSLNKKLLMCSLSLYALFSPFSHAAKSDLIFVTAPTHSAAETKKLYTPIVNFLSKKTGKKFRLDVPSNFIAYSRAMQKGNYDLIFDGPHLAAWRIQRLQHSPIARFPGKIKIVVVTKEKSKHDEMKDLQYGNKVCSFVPPNMLTMIFLSHYPSVARQPNIVRVQGFKKLIACVKQGKGEAAVLRDKLWGKAKKLGASKGLKIIAKPPQGYPERTFTAGPRIDAKLREKISQLLLSDEGKKVMTPLLKRFKKKNLIKAPIEDYVGLESLISSIWGFQ